MPVDSASITPVEIAPMLRDGYEVHQAALRRGMNVLLLPRQVMMIRPPGGEELSFVHGVPSTSTLSAVTYAQDKRMRRARLMEEGLPVPKGGTFSIAKGVEDAKRLIRRMGHPVVIKPAMGDNMIEVHAGLYDEQAVDEAIDYLRTHVDERATYVKAAYALTLLGDPEEVDGRLTVPRNYRFLVEKQVSGEYLRFLVNSDRVVSVVHCPKGPHHPEANRDVTDGVHASLVTLALAASRAVAGLSVAAVDLVVGDLDRDVAEQEVWIVDLSERPWLAAQAAISESLGHSLGDAILTSHAAEQSIELAEVQDEVALDIRVEGLTHAPEAIGAYERAARERGISAELRVSDPVEGIIEGAVQGRVVHVALINELLLDGRLGGHKAMLIEQRHRARSATPGSSRAEHRAAEQEDAVREWTADILSDLLDGQWNVPPRRDWRALHVATRRAGVRRPETLFIAIDRETWLKSTGNSGIYATWQDTHDIVSTLGPNCVGAILQRTDVGITDKFPQFVMADSYAAIRTMAGYARDRMSGTVIAITGTVGKSTVKDMLASVLVERGSVVATRGNENTRTGVPLTLANCITDPDYCVLEVAQSALWMSEGSICLLARPHVVVVTEIGITQARRISTEEMTAQVKARIAQGIEPGGVAVLNRDMAHFDLVRREVENFGARVVTYGFGPDADIRALSWESGTRTAHAEVQAGNDVLDVSVNMPGKGMVANTLAVLAVASVIGADLHEVAAGCSSFTLPNAKLDQTNHALGGGSVTVIDDSHNAAPLAMLHALEVVGSYDVSAGRRVAVLGRMVDLGDRAEELHSSLAAPVRASGIDLLITYGDEMRYLRQALPDEILGPHCSDAQQCVGEIMAQLRPGDVVLIKGSRRASDFGRVGAELRKRLG